MPRATEALDIKGVTTHNSMLDLSGKRKKFCVGCGGPRDVKLAETLPCFCCNSLGTQDTQPVFDEFDELVPAEIVEARRAVEKQARVARLQAGREAARAAAIPVEARSPKAAIVQDYPESDAAKAIKLVQKAQQAKPTTAKERKQAAAGALASMF